MTRRDMLTILLTMAADADANASKESIEAALVDYPNVTVNTPADITRNAQQSVDQLLGIVTALLLLAVVVAVLLVLRPPGRVVPLGHEVGGLERAGLLVPHGVGDG